MDIIDDEEFLLRYDIKKPSNPDFRFWDYMFDVEKLNDSECNAYFRFMKADLYRLKAAFSIPDVVKCKNGLKVDGIEALCIMLQRYAFPCRYGDMVKTFARPVPQLCMVSTEMTNHLYEQFHGLLNTLNQPWLSSANLQKYAFAIHAKGAALSNCWAFVDGTVRPICRPGQNQRVMYNGHKRIHAIKFQSVVAPNGLIANLFGPIEGRRHDSYMLRESHLLEELEGRSHDPEGNPLCIYGDPAYPLRGHLQAPFRGNLTPMQEEYNKAMSKVRISVEWLFGDIVNFFKFVDFKKTQKIGLSPVGKMYTVCALLLNAHTCLYGNTTSTYFELDPPELEEYFQ